MLRTPPTLGVGGAVSLLSKPLLIYPLCTCKSLVGASQSCWVIDLIDTYAIKKKEIIIRIPWHHKKRINKIINKILYLNECCHNYPRLLFPLQSKMNQGKMWNERLAITLVIRIMKMPRYHMHLYLISFNSNMNHEKSRNLTFISFFYVFLLSHL